MPSEWANVVELLISRYFKNRQEFNKLSYEMRVFYCYKNSDIRETLLRWIGENVNHKSEKCSVLSEEFREKGNQEFKRADDKASLILYTKGVIYAPHGSRELSLALGNRSAVLFRLQKYEECIADIDYAVENFDNSDLYPKLVVRKIKCLSRLRRQEEGLQCLNSLKDFLASRRDEFTHSMEKQLEDCEKELNQVSVLLDAVTSDAELPELLRGGNETFPGASNALELELHSERGSECRRVCARETIEAGEVIIIEKSFSFVLLPECGEEHCQFCCKPLCAPIACSTCVDSLYCSHKCMTKARDTYHKWECLGQVFLRNLGVGHLAFRTFLRTSLNSQSVHCKQIDALVTHLNDIPDEDILSYILTSTLLMIYLEDYTDFTSSYKELTIEGVGFSLLKRMIQIICNAFAMKKSSNYLSLVTYASGMFPSAAMMNHSCEPNIITSFHNDTLVVRANRRIERGEEVFNCYGPHFRKMNKKMRKEILTNQFFFDCKCKHCNSDGVEQRTLCICLKCHHPFDVNGRRPEEIINCSSCSSVIDLQIYGEFFKQAINLRERGVNSMNAEDYEEACQLFNQCERLLTTFLERCDIMIFDNTIDLAECYFMLGDYKHSLEKFLSNIAIASEHFDEYDVEFATLISRTIDAFLSLVEKGNGVKVDDEIEKLWSLSDKMVNIVKYNFGDWSEEYSVLLEKRRRLIDLRSSIIS